MNDDKALLAAAAGAAGMHAKMWAEPGELLEKGGWVQFIGHGHASVWNPLTDDGDALRLAVKLNITVFIYDDETSTALNGVVAKNWGSKEANTRRAIVMAAASLGQEAKHG